MNDLVKILEDQKNQSERFSANFTASVMDKIKSLTNQEVKVISMWQSRIWKMAAACFVGCLISLYTLDGTITVDSVLGLSEYSDIEIGQSYETYESWDVEIN